jgi:hypothetical protein
MMHDWVSHPLSRVVFNFGLALRILVYHSYVASSFAPWKTHGFPVVSFSSMHFGPALLFVSDIEAASRAIRISW